MQMYSLKYTKHSCVIDHLSKGLLITSKGRFEGKGISLCLISGILLVIGNLKNNT